MSSNLMTVEQFAKRCGITRQTAYKHIRQGKISKGVIVVGGKKKINPDVADRELSENIDQIYNPTPRKKARPTKPEMEQTVKSAGFEKNTLSEAQRLHANYKAALLKLEYGQKSGLLVEAEQVKSEAFESARMVRDTIMNIPDRISAELASCNDVHAVNQKLTVALTEALEELSEKLTAA